MPICYCDKCRGRFVPWHVRSNHQRTVLKNQTVSLQNVHKNHIPSSELIASSTVPISVRTPEPSPIPVNLDDRLDLVVDHEALNHGTTSGANDTGAAHFADYGPTDLETGNDNLEDLDEDNLVDPHDYDEERSVLIVSEPTEDNPDPFLVEHHNTQPAPNLREIPDHLLVIYVIVTWLHLQFLLPRIACQALLAFFARLLTFLDPTITPPFITLQSARRTLGIDSHIEFLPVCPNCRDVYPSTGSKHVQDMCTACKVPLFSLDQTKRGNQRVKTPLIRYPYLSLTDQLKSVLKVPGVETLLDEWRTKPRKQAEYHDIFDGRMCRLKLKAPNGTLFFSNHPHEKNGPCGELRIRC